ncbi:MAG: hypothetical protein ACPG43_12565 [Alcanivoracaceae bacterium]
MPLGVPEVDILPFSLGIEVPAENEREALEKQKCLQQIAGMSLSALEILAMKSKKKGIENKLKKYAPLI